MVSEDSNKDILVERDEEGYLIDPSLWNNEIALALSLEENIVLGENYWIVLHYIRDQFEKKHIAPDVRHVFKHLAEQKDCDKKAAKQLLFDMFPYGYVKQACKLAGMKRPRAWSTG